MSKETLKKIKLILGIIQEKKKFEPQKQTFKFRWEDFSKFPLFNDPIALRQLFKKIEKESECIVFLIPESLPDHLWGKRLVYTTAHLTQAELERVGKDIIVVDRALVEELFTITVHVEDFEEFNKYYKKTNKNLEKGEAKKQLSFYENGNIKYGDLICHLTKNSDRYKVFKHLYEIKYIYGKKDHYSYYDEFPPLKTSSADIHRTIDDAIRGISNRIRKDLRLPKDVKIFNQERGAGYRLVL